ncbi:MAG: copper chaperone [Bacteroidales bacterium]|nr:copper chaperone [Bacteroidales bacterium]
MILFLTVTLLITASNGCRNSGSQKKTPETQKEEHAMLKTFGGCEMCKTRIEKAAQNIDGVSLANWDRDVQQLHLHFNSKKTSIEAISQVIVKTGHDTELDRADDEIYAALPECCKYRK